MVIEISVAVIAVAFIVLVIFIVMALLKARRTLDAMRRDLHHVSTEAIHLMRKLDALASDIKSKSESLNFVFRPFRSMNREKNGTNTLTDAIQWVGKGLILFDQLQAVVRRYAK
jgi:uncharacterized protein YoxC